MWHHVLSLDLVASVLVEDRAAHELLPWLLTDPRHAQPSDPCGFLWVRPLDVPSMLVARSYLVPGRLVLEVVDAAGLTGDSFALDAGPDGASCVPTTASADLTLDVAVLGSASLVATACVRSPPRACSTNIRPAPWRGPMPCPLADHTMVQHLVLSRRSRR
jgi:predicted acetyltransferase